MKPSERILELAEEYASNDHAHNKKPWGYWVCALLDYLDEQEAHREEPPNRHPNGGECGEMGGW
jgi:hypothetical protein